MASTLTNASIAAPAPAVVLANHVYRTNNGKVAHGLIRYSTRFKPVAIVDPDCAGTDAGVLLDGHTRDVPVCATLSEALRVAATPPEYCVVGMATHGGRFTPELLAQLRQAAAAGLSLVNGLHDYAGDDPEIADTARRMKLQVIDLRRPRPKHELHFWSGEILRVRAPRIAVLGTDCAIGKRTTTRMLTDALSAAGVKAEMIYTGQTGWMQGGRYGFVLDSVINDYVSGELEHAIVSCDREVSPDVMLLEGQASLRNPSGPCGAEFLLSAQVSGVVLQHAPGRHYFEGFEDMRLRIPSVDSEVNLIARYGVRTIAITLHEAGMEPGRLARERVRLQKLLGIPVVRPLRDGVASLVPVLRELIDEARR